MRMSSRVTRAVRELRGALDLAAENPKELSGILRCYRETLPTVSKKTAAISSSGFFTQRLLREDADTLPVSRTSVRNALRELNHDPRPDPEWLGHTAERLAETLTVHFIDDLCDGCCDYELGTYVTPDGQLVLRCRSDAHVWLCVTSAAGRLVATERWEDPPELAPALLGDLQNAGVVLDHDEA